jgi:hypothetical protein
MGERRNFDPQFSGLCPHPKSTPRAAKYRFQNLAAPRGIDLILHHFRPDILRPHQDAHLVAGSESLVSVSRALPTLTLHPEPGQIRRRLHRRHGGRAKTCDAILGITDEGAEIMKDYKGMPALDAGLLAAAQAVEHYEMSRYGTLRTWAEELGMPDAAALLEATLKEEKATDAALTTLAKSVVNVEAEQGL